MDQFVTKQKSGRGTSHPITARLSVQTNDNLDLSGLDKSVKDGVLKECLGTLPSRLGRCWDIWKHLEEELNSCKIEFIQSKNKQSKIPQIHNLDRDVENFLYESKNFLRDLGKLVLCRCFSDLTYSDAGSFYKPNKKGDGLLMRWSEFKFGVDDGFTKMIRDDIKWISEIIDKGNAVEHPGGHSGNLKVQNIKLLDGQFVAPVWQRRGEATPILQDMGLYCQNLLEFAEEMIIFGCVQKTNKVNLITFSKIPENERNKDCPIRFRHAP